MKRQNIVWCSVAAVLLAVLLVGCATTRAATRMTSQLNREAAGRSFGKVLVHGNFQNLEYRQLAESKLCAELAGATGVACLKSAEVFFPAQEYSAEQIAERLSELSVDAVLTLQPTGSGTSSMYLLLGSLVTPISKPWANYEVVLWSTSDGKVAWYATAASGGNARARWDDLINSASSKAVSKLISDGVFQKLSK